MYNLKSEEFSYLSLEERERERQQHEMMEEQIIHQQQFDVVDKKDN